MELPTARSTVRNQPSSFKGAVSKNGSLRCVQSNSQEVNVENPVKVDPLVSLMMVEKVPDSTYEMIGGLDKQIKEIKEVIYSRGLRVRVVSGLTSRGFKGPSCL